MIAWKMESDKQAKKKGKPVYGMDDDKPKRSTKVKNSGLMRSNPLEYEYYYE